MSKQFTDKVAIITGGSNGIGRSTALAMAEQGAIIVIADINTEDGEETVRLVHESGGQSTFIQTDVTKSTEAETLVAKTVETYGRLDYAFNNAGVGGGPGQTVAECEEEVWDQVMNVNLKGVWLCMKYEVRHMLTQGHGAIVNTASIYGLVGFAGTTPYTVSKHGVVGLTRSGALQYAKQDIRINAVCPGWTYTAMTEQIVSDPEAGPKVISRHPIGRLGNSEEIAQAVLYLFSDAASFVTGHAFAADGGYTAQ